MGNIIYLNRYINREEVETMDIYDIAETFLTFGLVSHKKLQKLCYYAYCWFLVNNGRKIIDGVEFEAWVHGPVCRDLYYKYRQYGSRYIMPKNGVPDSVINNPEIHQFLNDIYEIYGGLSANELEELTHSEAPWIEARQGLGHYDNGVEVINDEVIIEYYGNKLV